MKFYVYEHWRPDVDLCFYVGKGAGPRARNLRNRNAGHAAVVKQLADSGMCVEVRMVASGLTEAEAFQIERDRIRVWRELGVELANRTSGGDGFSGFVRPTGIRLSEAAKQKLSESRKGIQFSAEHRAKLSAKKQGIPRKPFTEETRAKMRAASEAREAAKRAKFGTEVRRDSKIKI